MIETVTITEKCGNLPSQEYRWRLSDGWLLKASVNYHINKIWYNIFVVMYSVTWPHWVKWKGLQQWDHMLPRRSIFHLRMAWNLTGPRQPRAQWRPNSNPLAYRDQISHWVVNVVSEDGLAPYGARASADTMKTKFLCSKQESQCLSEDM